MVVGGGDRRRENRLYLETHDVCSRENRIIWLTEPSDRGSKLLIFLTQKLPISFESPQEFCFKG
jgi:hypothetical protein